MQNPEDLVRATQQEQDGGAIAGETGPLEDLDALSKELGSAPGGGDVISHGGLGRRILSVFFENKLAGVGVIVIVFFLLFCYVGPLLYHTNQTNASQALLATVFRPSLTVFIFVIAFVSWLIPVRLIRGQALSLRNREYVQAVKVLGE